MEPTPPVRAERPTGPRRRRRRARALEELLEVQARSEPQVTVVLRVGDGWDLLAPCLEALSRGEPELGFRVHLVVTVPEVPVPAWVGRLPGVAVRPAGRWGEGEADDGARDEVDDGTRSEADDEPPAPAGSSAPVLLLHPEFTVEPGAVSVLLETLRSSPDVGIVGGSLLRPDGLLEQAGGIVRRDGTLESYGAGENPWLSRNNFVRDVDYCSAAFLLVRPEIFGRAGGGPDLRLGPEYAGADLCTGARRMGSRVVYQPRATATRQAVRRDGPAAAAAPTGLAEEEQRRILLERWGDVLADQPPPGAHLRAVSWRRPQGRILVIDQAVPAPDQSSGSFRMHQLLRLLTGLGYAVTFSPDDRRHPEPYTSALRQAGVEVLDGGEDLDYFLQGAGSDLCLVVLSRPEVAAANILRIRSAVPTVPLVYDTVDLHHLREERRARIDGDDGEEAARRARRYRVMELALAELSDFVWTCSDADREHLVAELPAARVFTVPNVHPLQPAGPPFEGRRGILFVGSYDHPPNRDAAAHLVREVLPRVREELADVPATIAGSHPPPEVSALAGSGVEVPGWVADLGPLYRHHRLLAAPLRFGAGMKGKVGEALAWGLPVVTTPIGTEGMGLVDRRDVVVAEGTDELARAIVEVYGDGELWRRLATNGRETISRCLSPAVVEQVLLRFLDQAGAVRT